MRLKGFIGVIASVVCIGSAKAQVPSGPQPRMLILLDESSSMLQKWPNGKFKYKAAGELIMSIVDSVHSVDPNVEFSLRVFGAQFPSQENNCYDSRNEVEFNRDNRVQLALRLEDIQPRGVTPIAYALQEAAKYDIVDEKRNVYSIILITDGGESCGGDLCGVMDKLMRSKIYFKPYIVSLENDPSLRTTYSCMGSYLQVTRPEDVRPTVATIVDAFRPMMTITPTEYKKMQTIAASAPSVLKVNVPIKPTVDTADKPKPIPEVVAEKPKTEEPPKSHGIKTGDTWVKPPADNVARLEAAPLRRMFAARNTTITSMRELVVPEMPELKIETIAVVHTSESVNRLAMVHARQLPVHDPSYPVLTTRSLFPLPELVYEPPVVEHTKETIGAVKPVKPIIMLLHSPEVVKLRTRNVPDMPPLVMEKPEPVKITGMAAAKPVKLGITDAKMYTIKPFYPQIPYPTFTLLEDEPAPRTPVKIAKLKPAPAKTFVTIWLPPDDIRYTLRVPPLPPLKIDPTPAPATAKTTKPAPKPSSMLPGKDAEVKVETADAPETSVEVYFTNGRGKFYATTPAVYVMAPGTNSVIKKFYRTTDENGKPDQQKNIPVGSFDFAVGDKMKLHITNQEILPDKVNKIIFTVPPATLSFAYEGKPGEKISRRPVNEFTATVIERNKVQGRVENQPCTKSMEYEPGNYHVEINTFPVSRRNIDLDFEESVIQIPEPGFLKVTVADPKIHDIFLYQSLGDKFLSFYRIDPANPEMKHKQIQPGEYQVHYQKGPANLRSPEKVVTVRIKSNEESAINLE